MVIEFYEDDGCLGGNRGLSIDIDEKTITKWNSNERKMTLKDLDDVIFVIQKNITIALENIQHYNNNL